MDTTDPNIQFDHDGVCDHCHRYRERLQSRVVSGTDAESALARITDRIKREGKGRPYDCIVGVSGGVDSTYVAMLAVKMGLRPLAVHFDNGWNSELAVANIQKALDRLQIHLFTYVVDWDEFKDLQLSFLKASVPDVEVPTDHGIYAVLMRQAIAHNIRYVIHGMNYRTEGITVEGWGYGHSDWKYISSLQHLYGSSPLKTFPHFSLPYLGWALLAKRVSFFAPLNYLPYERAKAAAELSSTLDWRDYGGKHHESVYTRFVQTYLLPRKFNIDKRKCHLATQIHAGTPGMTREKALDILATPTAPQELLERDKEFVIKKFGVSPQWFESMMAAPPRSFRDYPNNYNLVKRLKGMQLWLRQHGLLYR